jgi:hypothetical protein
LMPMCSNRFKKNQLILKPIYKNRGPTH